MRTQSAALLGLLMALGAARADAAPFDGCGYVRTGTGGCRVLYELDPPQATTLLRLPAIAYDPATIYRVTGELAACDSLCGLVRWQRCLTVADLVPCASESLGCGILEPTPFGCGIWNSPRFGRVELPGFGDFAAGDTVQVVGLIDRVTASFCQAGDGQLRNYELARCPTRLVPVRATGWGRLKAVYR